jgi:small conductance mechanosensitive channel
VVSDSLFLLLRVYLIISIGRLLVTAVAAIVDSLNELSQKYTSSANLQEFYDNLCGLIPLFKGTLEYIIYVSVATLAIMQVEFIAPFATYGPIAIQIIGVVFLSRVAVDLVNLIVDKMLLKRGNFSDVEWQQRLTMVPLFKSILKYAVYFTTLLFILRVLSINTAPILAAIGGVSIIIGLGAQSVINDMVSGIFILFENLYLVGDYIETSDARGYVEAIEIRTTHIRDPDGQLHILRNGEINEIINFSKEYTFAVVEIGVSYSSDLNQVYRLLGDIGQELQKANSNVLEATNVRGLENFGESELLIRTLTKVKPGTHRTVARHLRKRIKEVFDREGIDIPFPQRVLTFNNEPQVKE